MPYDTKSSVVNLNTDCLVCPVRDCLGRLDSEGMTSDWNEVLAPRQSVMPGAAVLVNAGDRLRAVYSVRGGCLKAYTLDADGNERIRGFYLPGDVVGLDALADGVSLANVAAVVPSQVCVAPVVALRQLMLQRPELGQRVMEQTSRELALALAISGDYSAEQRMAAFLLLMSQRMHSGALLRLPMAQRDIGNYLRLANETVCRTLKAFERRGWLTLKNHTIRLLDEQALNRAAAPIGIVREPAPLERAA